MFCGADVYQSLQVQAGCVPMLIAASTTGSQQAAVEATGSLAMITSTVSGKEALQQACDPAVLFNLLSGSDNMLLQRNVLNIISNVAESPQMRQELGVRLPPCPHLLQQRQHKLAGVHDTSLMCRVLVSWSCYLADSKVNQTLSTGL